MSMKPLIIEVAVNGGTEKARNPSVPKEPHEVAMVSLACLEAGAAIIHSHINTFELRGAAAAACYSASYRNILDIQSDAILYPTTVNSESVEDRFEHIAI